MYWLMSIDAIARIAVAMAFLFILVPALALPRRPAATFLESFFWNFGVGITLITVVGQLLTLGRLFSLPTLLLVAVLAVVLGQAISRGVSAATVVRESAETAILAFLNTIDGRINVRRRIRRAYRRGVAALDEKTRSPRVRWQIAGWAALTAVAAALRLYRPFASANLSFGDTYTHLYLVKLLEEGRQVDPAWGPYPRGMHFLLLAIHHLTNIDQILLMNFFGAVVGVLITLAVADAARRLSGSVSGGLIAGFLFATVIGGPRQYFLLGLGRAVDGIPFDAVLERFHRQTATLPQEVAIALLFPGVMFLGDYLRRRDRWHLLGFTGCATAIAAVHPGVLLPLLLMSLLMLLATRIFGTLAPGAARPAIIAGTLAVLVGSAWAIAFIAYPYAGGPEGSGNLSLIDFGAYYFPFVVSLFGGVSPVVVAERRIFTPVTPFLVICIAAAVALLVSSFVGRAELRVRRFWIAAVFLLFALVHFASMLGLPQILELRRSSQWLIMSTTILVGMVAVEVASRVRSLLRVRIAVAMAALVLGILWTSRVPLMSDPVIQERIVNFSGYSGSTLAVLRIERALEPYTWTLISYGQEFPMVLKRGFHMTAADFLDRYDPSLSVIPIPTPHVFIVVEKTPHRFQIETWARRFSRSEVQQRLQTWVYLYQTTHKNVRVFLEDATVRVYQIERTPEELERLTRRASQ